MIRLTKKRPTENMARFYCLQIAQGLFGNWSLVREWGRIGQPGTVRTEWYENEKEAESARLKLLRQKMKRGYSLTQTLI